MTQTLIRSERGISYIVSLEAKGSDCVCKWLVVKPICLSTDDGSADSHVMEYIELCCNIQLEKIKYGDIEENAEKRNIGGELWNSVVLYKKEGKQASIDM